MKIREKMSINDLSFGVVLRQTSWSNTEERNVLKAYNLFDFSRIKLSVAKWVTMPTEERKQIANPLSFLFGDVWGRCEFEYIICPWPFDKDDKVVEHGQKVDIYQMYVVPNADLLMDLVSRVTKSSARAYLREWRKMHRR